MDPPAIEVSQSVHNGRAEARGNKGSKLFPKRGDRKWGLQFRQEKKPCGRRDPTVDAVSVRWVRGEKNSVSLSSTVPQKEGARLRLGTLEHRRNKYLIADFEAGDAASQRGRRLETQATIGERLGSRKRDRKRRQSSARRSRRSRRPDVHDRQAAI